MPVGEVRGLPESPLTQACPAAAGRSSSRSQSLRSTDARRREELGDELQHFGFPSSQTGEHGWLLGAGWRGSSGQSGRPSRAREPSAQGSPSWPRCVGPDSLALDPQVTRRPRSGLRGVCAPARAARAGRRARVSACRPLTARSAVDPCGSSGCATTRPCVQVGRAPAGVGPGWVGRGRTSSHAFLSPRSARRLGRVVALEPLLQHVRPRLPGPHAHLQAPPVWRQPLRGSREANQVLQHCPVPW